MKKLSFSNVMLWVGLAFIYLPMLIMVIYSFNASKLVTVWGGWSIKWYAGLLDNSQLMGSVGRSLEIALYTAVAAVALGTLAAFVLTRVTRFKGRTLFGGLVTAPLVMPEVITGLSLLLLFVAMAQLIGWPQERGIVTIWIAHTTFCSAYVAVVVSARLRELDLSIEEAAMDLGAKPWKVFFLITIPMIAPSLAAGGMMSFALSLDDLVLASFVSGPGSTTLPMEVFSAVRLGVNSDEDLLGGFVEHAFIAGKAIVHPLPRGGVAPEGWNPLFAEKVRDVVLNGVSVFSLADAHRAGARMLAEGPVRAKLAEACGGLGQYVAHDLDELDAWLGGLEERQLAQGLVLEANLESIVTHSVGQLRVNGFLLSYHGHQHQTRNARGELVYAGSDLLVARGGYAELLALDLAREVRQAIEYARIFDTAAAIFFPGCFASRRNYDIAQGRDGNGRERFGVLEQSWRVGGASSAEIAALEAFRADPGLPAVRAASFEIHEDKRLPDNSRVIYRGPDEHGDFLLKYAMTGEA